MYNRRRCSTFFIRRNAGAGKKQGGTHSLRQSFFEEERKMKKRILSLLLTLVMLVGMIPATSLTAFAAATTYNYVVCVGGVSMHDGDYLAVGATATQTTKPSGGYAYYNDGTLTLNNYSYEGKGYKYISDISGGGRYATVYSDQDLTIELVGNNTIVGAENGGSSYGIYMDAPLTITGNGSLTVSSADAPTYWSVGIYASGNIHIKEGCSVIAYSGEVGRVTVALYQQVLTIDPSLLILGNPSAPTAENLEPCSLSSIRDYDYVEIISGGVITLNTNGGTINSGDVDWYTKDSGATLPTDVTKNELTFKGWYDNEELNGEAVTAIPVGATGAKEFWAKWSGSNATYTVSFDANGGTGTMADVPDIAGEYTLPENGFTAPDGKQFKGWSVGDEELDAGDVITVSEDTVVTALWEIIPEQSDCTIGGDWKFDDENHWKMCSCGEKEDVAPHEDANTDGACDVCGAELEPVGGAVNDKDETDEKEPAKDKGDKNEQNSQTPNTGDDSKAWLWCAILLVSGVSLSAALVIGQKKDMI
jgi:hypothetical protein